MLIVSGDTDAMRHCCSGHKEFIYIAASLSKDAHLRCKVPCDLLSGVITPVVKDSEGDISSTANYQVITLSVVFASLFESAILNKIGYLMKTHHLLFFNIKHYVFL